MERTALWVSRKLDHLTFALDRHGVPRIGWLDDLSGRLYIWAKRRQEWRSVVRRLDQYIRLTQCR